MTYQTVWDVDTLSKALHKAADETDDARDHDELHAAGSVVWFSQNDADMTEDRYLKRWIWELIQRHGVGAES